MKRILSLILLLSCMFNTVKPMGQGNESPVSKRCPAGTFVTEIYGGHSNFVNSIGMRCSDNTNLGIIGSDTGTAYSIKNTSGFAGFTGKAGAWINKLQAIDTKGIHLQPLGGDSGGSPAESMCPTGKRVVGYNGAGATYAGTTYAGKLNIICEDDRSLEIKNLHGDTLLEITANINGKEQDFGRIFSEGTPLVRQWEDTGDQTVIWTLERAENSSGKNVWNRIGDINKIKIIKKEVLGVNLPRGGQVSQNIGETASEFIINIPKNNNDIIVEVSGDFYTIKEMKEGKELSSKKTDIHILESYLEKVRSLQIFNKSSTPIFFCVGDKDAGTIAAGGNYNWGRGDPLLSKGAKWKIYYKGNPGCNVDGHIEFTLGHPLLNAQINILDKSKIEVPENEYAKIENIKSREMTKEEGDKLVRSIHFLNKSSNEVFICKNENFIGSIKPNLDIKFGPKYEESYSKWKFFNGSNPGCDKQADIEFTLESEIENEIYIMNNNEAIANKGKIKKLEKPKK